MRRRSYSNLMLTVIAGLLALSLVDRATSTEGSIASVPRLPVPYAAASVRARSARAS